MKILLAPSETKNRGGVGRFNIGDLLFDRIGTKRRELLGIYDDILSGNDMEKINQMFGLKKVEDVDYYKSQRLSLAPTMSAIERYTGVAFDYLGYNSLNSDMKSYLNENLIIFSNLFGVLSAGDQIPDYRLKQGATVGNIKTDKYYNPIIKEPLDALLANEDILDIRAGYYDKFYKPSKPYTTLKFMKGGKVVSHWAKAYRGIVLREIAKANVRSIDEFMSLPIRGLRIKEIQTKRNKSEILYDIESS